MKKEKLSEIESLMYTLARVEKDLERLIHYVIILFTVIFVASVVYGAILGDFIEIETVGSVMCLSCMGLQQ